MKEKFPQKSFQYLQTLRGVGIHIARGPLAVHKFYEFIYH